MVSIEFKKKFNFFSNIFIILVLIFGLFVYADTNALWTEASDIKNGTFGQNEGGGNYIFPDNLSVEENFGADKFCDENMENCVDYADIVALFP